MAISKFTGKLLRHIRKPTAVKLPKQAKPPIPKKTFIQKHKTKIATTGGLLVAGSAIDEGYDKIRGRDKKGSQSGVNVFVIQKRTNVRQTR